MNYIEQINVFWKLDAEHSFNGNETRLYMYLLNLSNSLYWKNPLTNADGYTASMVGISVNTLKNVRNRIQQAGLITFKPGGNGSRDKCKYYIVPAAQVIRDNANKVSNSDTLLNDSLTPYLIPGMGKPDDISKQKPNQTKSERVQPPPLTNGSGWNTRPGADAHALDLPDINIGQVTELFGIAKRQTVSRDQVIGLWKIFKIQWFTGHKYYASESETFSHFLNWCKTMDVKDIPAPVITTNGLSAREQQDLKILQLVNGPNKPQ